MQENTNKILFANTLILYLRLAVTSILGLFSTRYALQALGVVDYGLYSVLGSIITFILIINTIMISSSHRFIAVAIGEKDVNNINEVFNVCFVIHACIAIITLLLAIPLGKWYICNYLNYEGNTSEALNVFYISILASAFTFLGVPYNALLMAKEKFWVFCLPDMISSALKLFISILLLYFFENKLIVYAVWMAMLTAYPTIVFYRYCRKYFKDICNFKFVKEKKQYREILSFSSWVAYGAVAFVGKSQGAAIIVNNFFNTIMNTALGIANSVQAIINNFSQNVSKPIAPQITKSFAAGEMDRCNHLLILSTKLTYLVMFFISMPFIVGGEWILQLWLGSIPEYAIGFMTLIIIDSLIDALNAGVKEIIFASGKIKAFQVVPSTLKLLAVVAAFFTMKRLGNPYSIQYVYIAFSVLNFFIVQLILNKTLNFDIGNLIKHSYIPSTLVTLLYLPMIFLKGTIHPAVLISVSLMYLAVVIFYVGFSKQERHFLINMIKRK